MLLLRICFIFLLGIPRGFVIELEISGCARKLNKLISGLFFVVLSFLLTCVMRGNMNISKLLISPADTETYEMYYCLDNKIFSGNFEHLKIVREF